jgi:hypothetical protein
MMVQSNFFAISPLLGNTAESLRNGDLDRDSKNRNNLA